MTAQELAARQAGENLDQLMNLDPRGYGVCRTLYPAARALTGEPLTLASARELLQRVGRGKICYVLTGFVLLPHRCPETDGMVSAVLLCRLLAGLLGAVPVLVCPEECRQPAEAMAAAAGLHLYDHIGEARALPASLAFAAFPKEEKAAGLKIRELMEAGVPSAAVAVELPGANGAGVYHNAAGIAVTQLEAKTDLLLAHLASEGVFTVAIGDLGNEAGLAALTPHLRRYIPGAGEGECQCGCGGGIAAAVRADQVITATTSDWGCCGLMAALGFLRREMSWTPDGALYERVLRAGCENGLVDMTGWRIPAVDGFGLELLRPVVDLMKATCQNILDILRDESCSRWFEGMAEKGFWQE